MNRWNRVNPSAAHRLLAVIGIFILFCLIAFSKTDSYFLSGDESGYFANLELIERYGISAEFLRHFSGMAGPLHPIIQWILLPLTGGVPPGIRLVNFAVLLLILWQFRHERWYRVMSIPMTFICAGYAMTEIPAMLFLLIGLLLLRKERVGTFDFLLVGLSLSLAIAGRWNYLVLLPAFLFYMLKIRKYSTTDVATFVASSLIFPLWIGIAWRGISPPEVSGLPGYNFFDVKPDNFILSACFAGMMVFMLSPNWYAVAVVKWRQIFLVGCAVLVSNSCFNLLEFLPGKSLFNRIPATVWPYFEQAMWQRAISLGFGSLAIFVSTVFLYVLYRRIRQNPKLSRYFMVYQLC